MSSIDARVCETAWQALVVVLPFVLWRLARVAGRDLLISLLLGALALAPRLWLPWGPLNFVEPERLLPLWARDGVARNEFLAIPLALQHLQKVGLGLETLLHYVEPVVGGLSVALTYACARAFTLERRHAVLAAVLVAFSPAHVHFSESLSFSVESGALIAAILAATAAASLDWLAIPLITTLVTIAVHTRPELRVFLIPVGLLVFLPGSHWTKSKQIGLCLALALALASYLPLVIKPQAQTTLVLYMRSGPLEFANWLAHTFLLNGLPWLVIGAIGFFRKSLPSRQRWSLLAGILIPCIVYWCLASDPSYLWTQWRYYVTLVPLLSIAAAAEIARWRPNHNALVVTGCVAAAAAVLALEWHVLRLPNDQQTEFQYVREVAPELMPPNREIYMVQSQDCEICEGSAALALSTLYGSLDLSADGTRSTSAVKLLPLNEKTVVNDAGGLVYVGSRRRLDTMEFLRARFEIKPVRERVLKAIADHRQCEIRSADDAELKCSMQLGWYHFRPRAPAPPVLGSGD